jgi:STE24 endopeptidase
MNAYALTILAALLLNAALDAVANALNLKRLRRRPPPEFRDMVGGKAYRRSGEYTRSLTRFGFVSSAFDLAVLLAFWFSGGFNILDLWVRRWALHPVLSGLAYIFILLAFHFILSLPFSLYGTFVIEERFGFNRTTPGTFARDAVKTVILSLVLGFPLLAGMLAFFQYAGPWGWLAAWAGAVAFTLLVQFIAPAWILPLFNKFTPLRNGRLKQGILTYARSVRYPLSGVFVMDGSRRSTKSNAFFTGFGKNRRIALYDTLIAKHTVPELVSVLAHEIGHYRKKHVLVNLLLGITHTGLLLFLFSQFLSRPGLFNAFFMEHRSVYAGMIFFGLLYTPVEMFLSVGLNALSRRHEFAADAFAVATFGHGGAFIRALKKLSIHNLSNLTPHPFHVFLHHSHPPVLERIRRIGTMPGRRVPKTSR